MHRTFVSGLAIVLFLLMVCEGIHMELEFCFSDDEGLADGGETHHRWLLSQGYSYCSVCNKRIR